MSSFYFLGIGGTAMASVAVALSHAGHAVTGSDTQLYPPMSTYLDEHNIRYFNGFSDKNLLAASPDAVIVGNAISRGNPELEYALDHHYELLSMPDLVRHHLIGQNSSMWLLALMAKQPRPPWLPGCLKPVASNRDFWLGVSLKIFRLDAGIRGAVKMAFL